MNNLKTLGAIIIILTVTFFVMDYWQLKQGQVRKNDKLLKVQIRPDEPIDFDHGNQQRLHDVEKRFLEMQKKIMEEAFKEAEKNGDEDFSIDRGIGVERSEDAHFVYLHLLVGKVDKESLNINIRDGHISIEGRSQVIQESENSSTTSISEFSQSFPAPQNVDESRVTFEVTKDGVLLKFPKR